MKKSILICCGSLLAGLAASAQGFSSGNLVVLQTSGTASKAGSAVTLKEYTTAGTAGSSVAIPSTGSRAFQTSGVYGGSEGFLSTSTDGKYLVMGGYGTGATYTDITGTAAAAVPRIISTVSPSGFYLQVASSNTSYSANDIRGAVSDGTNYWASGASVASADGINYFGPGTPAALAVGATPPKAYGLRIFNGQIYYSTQKAGPTNSATQMGILTLGTGMPVSGTVTVSQLINTGSNTPQDFSFNAAADICYVAINMNTAVGGIQKWTRSGTTWTLAYTLGTGATNTGAYGLVVDYSGTVPVLYATTSETAGNRVIKVVDNGTAATATITTLVAAVSNVFNKGISFAPVASGTPVINLTLSADTASEAGASAITVTATTSFAVATAQSVSLGVSGTGITSGDYTLSATTLTIPAGGVTASATFTVKDDILGEGTEVAAVRMQSPTSGLLLGIDSIKTITIADNDGNNFPVIRVNTDSTTDFIDGAVSVAPASPFKLSGVWNDPSDPAATIGIAFTVSDLETADTSLKVRVSSSNTAVVPDAGLVLSGTDSMRHLKIAAVAVGYADITVTVNDGTDSVSYVVNYAASAVPDTGLVSYWHTGMSDASAAIALDSDYYIAGDDELNILNVYARKASGLPLSSFNYTAALALPEPAKPEVDLEAATRSLKHKDRLYWLGSMSNGKSPFDNKPNRDRLFATTLSGAGKKASFAVVGYTALRNSIIAWGDALGYNFTASAAAGMDSKLPGGFAAEGMVFGPDSTTLYIGLRAPLVPLTARKKALIVPVTGFETWFNDGSPVTASPTLGSPIELDLGGLGIRDLIRLPNSTYVIIAGNVGGAPLAGAIYKWNGKAADAPIAVVCPDAVALNMEGVMPVTTGGSLALDQLQIITDNGDDVFYKDGIVSKDFGDLVMRKFRSVYLDGLDLTMKPGVGIEDPVAGQDLAALTVYPNPAATMVNVSFAATQQEAYQVSVADMNGRKVMVQDGISVNGLNKAAVDMSALPKGIYLVQVRSASLDLHCKLLLR